MRTALRLAASALRDAMGNPGIRSLELSWLLSTAADAGLFVALLVVAYGRDGVLATGLLGAFRMAPAIVSGAASGAALRRWSGRRVLLTVATVRLAVALLAAVAIAGTAPTLVLLVIAAVGGAAGALVRPIQATLMPALARTPEELVAANVAWGTVEGVATLAGPAIAAGLIATGQTVGVAILASVSFTAGGLAVMRLRFEQASDALPPSSASTGPQLLEGLRTLRLRPVAGWSMLGVFAQTLTRGLLNALVVVAAIELLGLGDPGVGTLSAAMGVGGLLGGLFAMSLVRTTNLLPSASVALAFWGLPIAAIGLSPTVAVALLAMAVIGVANSTFDVAILTIFQRGCSNEERAPVFGVFEAVAGLGVVGGSLLGPLLITVLGNREAMVVSGAILPVVAVAIYGRVGRIPEITTSDERAVELLRRVPAFAALPLTGIERLASAVRSETHAAGQTLMRQGEAGDRFVVIEAGEVDVSVDGRWIHRLGPGAGIGEVALLRQTPRTATVVAVTDVRIVSIGSRDFCSAVSGPTALGLMERVVRERLARTGPGATGPA
ncbi:MAG: MFS transporter [Chloroflexi bacterium]|nr:MFS transporter [Chloroflexota bacterium]